MIINEGFLENAKKIAETQHQQSEVKVPEIKRENYTDYIGIIMSVKKNLISGKDIKAELMNIRKLTIFKETGDIKYTEKETEKETENGMTYNMHIDADLFWTIDSVYELCVYLENIIYKNRADIYIELDGFYYYMRYINNINNSKSIIKPDRIYFLFYLISIPVINPLTAFNGIIYNKYGYKTAQRNIIRWMNRNGCVMIPENYPYKSAILYAATISDMNGFMTGLKKEVIRYIGYNNERKYSSLYYDRNKDRITEKEEDYITHMLDISEFNIKSNGVYESNSNKDNNIFINIQNPQGIYDMLEGTKDECEVVIYCDPDETLEYKLYIPKIIHYEHMYYNVGITVGREYSPDMFYKLKRNLHNKIKDFKEPVNYGDNILNIK